MADHAIDRSAVSFRAIRPDDEAFLYRLYTTVREDVAATDWDEAQKTAFLFSLRSSDSAPELWRKI